MAWWYHIGHEQHSCFALVPVSTDTELTDDAWVCSLGIFTWYYQPPMLTQSGDLSRVGKIVQEKAGE